MSDYDTKYDAALAELARTQVWRSNYVPPLHKLQRQLGMQVRPPHYQPFLRVWAGQAVWFGIFWGVLMWFVEWRGAGVAPAVAMGSSAIAGVLFGFFMGCYYAHSRRKWRLSRWNDL
ncbi:DUF6404 family protein [Sulfitobacter sp. JB4-11]|uniref:DUF6404 family protein n=1 Tax=Sulfitobacter rhodophyticola TaxID=3238304 RepID=UPI003514AF26